MLFEPGRHEPLLDAQWEASRAHEAIRAIVQDTEEVLGSGIVWRAHPLDESGGPVGECVEHLYLRASVGGGLPKSHARPRPTAFARS